MRFPVISIATLGHAIALLSAMILVAGNAATGKMLLEPEPAIELASVSRSASVRAVIEGGEPQLRARLLLSSPSVVKGTQRRLGVLLDLEPGWHVYWRNPGGTGIAPELGLAADGSTIGEIAWPAPQTFAEADGLFTTWGYQGSVLLSAPLLARSPSIVNQAGEAGKSGTDVPMARANARVLICRTQCVPAEFELSTPLDSALAPRDQAIVDRLFEDSLAQVPISAALIGLEAQAHWTIASPAPDEPAALELTLETCRGSLADCPSLAQMADSSLFIPMEGGAFEFSSATVVSENPAAGEFVLGFEATRLEAGEDRLWGLVPLRDATGRLHHVEFDVSIGGALAEATPGAANASLASAVPAIPLSRWIQIILLAMLGGVILNGMPCVLPVLAIKVFAIAGMAEKDPREVKLHGLAYTLGVLGSMGLLALVVLGLRSAGHSVGWGFQFQEPLFVAAISAVLVTFALNLFGVFEIELGQGRVASVGQKATGLRRSVFEGLLAVVLATPCTAPFLGTAVGFAFASSGLGIAAIFLAIGFGLAFPFLAVSFLPSLARFIPRSGPWMNTLRSGLGFSLLATVVWLLWVLGQSGGVSAVVSMTGVLLFLGFLLWGFGQMQPLRSAWLGRISAVAIAGLAFAGFNLIEFDRPDPGLGSGEALSELPESGWAPYSEDAVAETLAAGRPVFVVFTADWCITCKVNEHTVLDRDAIREAFSDRNYALFKADWTRRDEGIRLKLAEFGRAGVPLYLVYRTDRPNEPQVLSELLSAREVLAALESASQASRI